MKKGSLCHQMGMVSWAVTALAALNIGLAVFAGWNFFETDLMMTSLASFARPLYALIGLSGAYSLYGFAQVMMDKSGKCGMCK